MDYIYQGEVQLYQDDLNNFLDTAQKLQIDGLIDGSNTGGDNGDGEDWKENNKPSVEEVKINTNQGHFTRTIEKQIVDSNAINSYTAADELVEKVEKDLWRCKTCDKKAKKSIDIKRHAETHLDGLSFECPICYQSFRSRNSLRSHKQLNHKIN